MAKPVKCNQKTQKASSVDKQVATHLATMRTSKSWSWSEEVCSGLKHKKQKNFLCWWQRYCQSQLIDSISHCQKNLPVSNTNAVWDYFIASYFIITAFWSHGVKSALSGYNFKFKRELNISQIKESLIVKTEIPTKWYRRQLFEEECLFKNLKSNFLYWSLVIRILSKMVITHSCENHSSVSTINERAHCQPHWNPHLWKGNADGRVSVCTGETNCTRTF